MAKFSGKLFPSVFIPVFVGALLLFRFLTTKGANFRSLDVVLLVGIGLLFGISFMNIVWFLGGHYHDNRPER